MANQKKVVAVKKDEKGRISAVRFEENKNFTSLETAIRIAERNEIENIHVLTRKDRKKWLRSNPNKEKKDNLQELAKDS